LPYNTKKAERKGSFSVLSHRETFLTKWMRRQKKPTFEINIRFSHFAPLISLPRTLFARSQTLYKPSADADPCSQTLYTAIQV
jgi:hypothetical protein